MSDLNPAPKLFDYYWAQPNDLIRIGLSPDWEVTSGDPDISDWTVIDRNDIQAGWVEDLLVDTTAGEAVFAIVRRDGVPGTNADRILLPIDQVTLDMEDEFVRYMGVTEDIGSAPVYHDENPDYTRHYDFWRRSSCVEMVTQDGNTSVLPVTRILVRQKNQ